ncbi:hypothetical protein CLOM_g2927 [Closterium sp. NIES-68]|nr:hypothetical protein CLOM_g2927 [Closterium sp. NIES-68]
MEGEGAANGDHAEISRAEVGAEHAGVGKPVEEGGAGEGERGGGKGGEGDVGERDDADAAVTQNEARSATGAHRGERGTSGRRTGGRVASGRGGDEEAAGDGVKAKGDGRRRSDAAADSSRKVAEGGKGKAAEGAKGKSAGTRKGERATRGSAGNSTSSPRSHRSSGAASADARSPGSSTASPHSAAAPAAPPAPADGAGVAAESAGEAAESAGEAAESAGAAAESAGEAAKSAGAAAVSAGAAAESAGAAAVSAGAAAESAGAAAVEERHANGADAERAGGVAGEGADGASAGASGGGGEPPQPQSRNGGAESASGGAQRMRRGNSAGERGEPSGGLESRVGAAGDIASPRLPAMPPALLPAAAPTTAMGAAPPTTAAAPTAVATAPAAAGAEGAAEQATREAEGREGTGVWDAYVLAGDASAGGDGVVVLPLGPTGVPRSHTEGVWAPPYGVGAGGSGLGGGGRGMAGGGWARAAFPRSHSDSARESRAGRHAARLLATTGAGAAAASGGGAVWGGAEGRERSVARTSSGLGAEREAQVSGARRAAEKSAEAEWGREVGEGEEGEGEEGEGGHVMSAEDGGEEAGSGAGASGVEEEGGAKERGEAGAGKAWGGGGDEQKARADAALAAAVMAANASTKPRWVSQHQWHTQQRHEKDEESEGGARGAEAEAEEEERRRVEEEKKRAWDEAVRAVRLREQQRRQQAAAAMAAAAAAEGGRGSGKGAGVSGAAAKRMAKRRKKAVAQLVAETAELGGLVEGRRARRCAVEYQLLHAGIFLDPPDKPSPEEAREEQDLAAAVEWLRGEVRVARRWMDVQRLVWINRDRQHRALLRRGGQEERAQLQHMIQQLESQLSQLERHEGLLREGNSQLNDALASGTALPTAASLSFASFSSLPADPPSSFPHDLSLSDLPDDASLSSEPHSALPPWLASPSTASASPAPSMGRPPSATRRSLPPSFFAQPGAHAAPAPLPSPSHSVLSLSGPLPSPRSRWRSRSRNASGRRGGLEPLAVGGVEAEEGLSDEASPQQPLCAPFTPTSARRGMDQGRGGVDVRMAGVAEREVGDGENESVGPSDGGALTPSSSRFWQAAPGDRRQAEREREKEREWERESARGGGAMDLAARFTRALSITRADADATRGDGKGGKVGGSGQGEGEAYRVEPGEGSTILHVFHQASRRMRSIEAGDFEIAECELFTARDDVDDLRAHPNLLSEHMLICLLRADLPPPCLWRRHLARPLLQHAPLRHLRLLRPPRRFPRPAPTPPPHHPPSRRRTFFRSRSAANPSHHSHSPRTPPGMFKSASGGYGSEEDAAGRPYPQAYGGVAVGGGGWEDGVSSTDGESPSGQRGGWRGWDEEEGGARSQHRRGRGRRGGGSMEEAPLTEVSEWEEVGEDEEGEGDAGLMAAMGLALDRPPSASPLRPRLRPRTPTTLWLRRRHRHQRSSGGGGGWAGGAQQGAGGQQGRMGEMVRQYGAGRAGGGQGDFVNPPTPSSGGAGALRLGRTTSTRVVTAVARVLPPPPPPAATPPSSGSGGAGAGAKGSKDKEKERGGKGKQGGKEAAGGAAAATAAAAKGELGADDFEKFFGTGGDVPAPTEWTSLNSAQLDPYGVLGEHPCPDAGNYIQMLAVHHPPSEGSMTHADATRLLHFRAMAAQLEDVDPSALAHNERLAFWINIYNALLLYIYIVIPVPTDFADRISLFSKVGFLIGGQLYSVLLIEHAVLRAASHKPFIIRALPGATFRPDDARSLCALTHPEPLVSFALCSGTRSSPSVRVYRAEGVQQQLRGAMVEFLGAAVSVNEANKIIIPKLLHWYAVDFAPDLWSLLEWLANVLPTNQAVVVMNCLPTGAANISASKCVAVAPFDWRFRYLIPPVLPM